MTNKAKIREVIKSLNPIDDIMFRKMAEDREFCEEILECILGEKVTVLKNVPQWAGTNLQGRSVILDLMCQHLDGRLSNVEVQNSDNDNQQKRARYNGSVLTVNVTDPGEKFEKIPDVYVIFILKYDIFKEGKAIYHVKRVIEETGEPVYNGFTEIYINATARDGSPISELMEIFTEDNAYSDKFPKTSARKRLFKESEKGAKSMSAVMDKFIEEIKEEIKKEYIEEGEKKGEKKGRENAENYILGNIMESMKCSMEQARKIAGLD